MGDAVPIITLVFVSIMLIIWIALIVGTAIFAPKLIRELKDKVDKADETKP